ncbi:general odorant-binding protein 19d-like [Anopheles maculipalpis]|uniref:general odorant-binding protein 19d-like n=1 Tax=Anopheles maculipalpis TaxID=1496333 RepID=UPI0021599BD5|nr:general odorant-binding protein 19d-like [Anopheles maculipalpis]
MKFSIALVAFCFAVTAVNVKLQADQAEEMEQAKEMLRGLAAECKTKEGATDDDVEGFVSDKMPESRTQKCLAGCMQEQFGISNGKTFQEDGFIEIAKMLMKGDESKIEVAKEIAADCKDVTNDDRCELAVDIMNCLKESAEKHGIELKH